MVLNGVINEKGNANIIQIISITKGANIKRIISINIIQAIIRNNNANI